MDALKTAPRLRVPVLYLAAEGDDNAGFDFSQDAEAMYAATASADKRLEVLPGSLHGIALDGRLGACEGARRDFSPLVLAARLQVLRDERVEDSVRPSRRRARTPSA